MDRYLIPNKLAIKVPWSSQASQKHAMEHILNELKTFKAEQIQNLFFVIDLPRSLTEKIGLMDWPGFKEMVEKLINGNIEKTHYRTVVKRIYLLVFQFITKISECEK